MRYAQQKISLLLRRTNLFTQTTKENEQPSNQAQDQNDRFPNDHFLTTVKIVGQLLVDLCIPKGLFIITPLLHRHSVG